MQTATLLPRPQRPPPVAARIDVRGVDRLPFRAAAGRPLATAMHRARKQVFIDTLGWPLACPDGEREIDRYDGPGTLYLIAADSTGSHLGSLRLLPSTGPHLLGDLFPGLCANGVPRAAGTWEISRLVTQPGLSPAAALTVRRHLALALLEHGLATGIDRLTMVTHLQWLPSLLAIGWDAAPLGPPQADAHGSIAALEIRVTAAARAALAAEWGIPGPCWTGISDNHEFGSVLSLAS